MATTLHNLGVFQSKEKISCRETWDLAELLVVINVIGDDNFTARCNSTLILQQIFKVANRSIKHGFYELACINRYHLYRIGEVLKYFMNIFFGVMAKQIAQSCEGHSGCACLNFSSTAKVKDCVGFSTEFSELNGIHQDICVKKGPFHSLIHFVKMPKVRASISLAVKFSLMACKRCASVRLSHAFCLSQVGAFLAFPRNLFVLADSGTLYFFRISSTKSLAGSDEVRNMFSLASLRAKKASSSWRLAASTSRMASCMYSTTACMTSTFVPFSNSKIGANDDSWIILAAAVIILPCFSSRCKIKHLF